MKEFQYLTTSLYNVGDVVWLCRVNPGYVIDDDNDDDEDELWYDIGGGSLDEGPRKKVWDTYWSSAQWGRFVQDIYP